MKLRIAVATLLVATAGSAAADGRDALAGLVVGTVIGSQISSHGHAHSSVSIHYGGYAPPVLVAPPRVVHHYGVPAPVVGYAPPPPMYGYAHPVAPPVVVYPAPPVHYGPPPGHGRWHHHHHHHRDFDHGPRGHHRW